LARVVGQNSEVKMYSYSFVLSCAGVLFVFIIAAVLFYQLYIIFSLVGFCRHEEKWIVKKENLTLKAVEEANKTSPRKKSQAARQ